MLIYTFRSTSFTEKLLETNTRVFVFGRMKEDFEVLSKKILAEKPDFIVGIAGAQESRFESKAINQFNQTKKVAQDGMPELNLHVPKNPIFPVAEKATDSFCNWTAYKIAKLIKENKLDTKMMFAHVHNKDMNSFLDYLSELE